MGKIKGFLKNYFLVEYFKAFFFSWPEIWENIYAAPAIFGFKTSPAFGLTHSWARSPVPGGNSLRANTWYLKLPSWYKIWAWAPFSIFPYLWLCSLLIIGEQATVSVKELGGMLFLNSATDPAGSSHLSRDRNWRVSKAWRWEPLSALKGEHKSVLLQAVKKVSICMTNEMERS